MPITFADTNTEYEIKRIKGASKAVKHLEDLGFYVGGMVTVMNKSGNDLIVKVKDSRIAISKEMANKIMI